MTLPEIYCCLCDETRLRILHLLGNGPLCVCHFQAILDAPQVAISKHLAYLRRRGVVMAQRRGQWMIYRLPEPLPNHLGRQLQCLRDCALSIPLFEQDSRRLKKVRRDCGWLEQTPQKRRPEEQS